MRVCQCGGVLTQRNLTPTKDESREAWTCTECQRYEIISRSLTITQFSRTLKESLMGNTILNKLKQITPVGVILYGGTIITLLGLLMTVILTQYAPQI